MYEGSRKVPLFFLRPPAAGPAAASLPVLQAATNGPFGLSTGWAILVSDSPAGSGRRKDEPGSGSRSPDLLLRLCSPSKRKI